MASVSIDDYSYSNLELVSVVVELLVEVEVIPLDPVNSPEV